jgi:ribosomal-protein-serine acetyltransferase
MFRRKVADGIEIKLFEPHEAETIYAVVERNRRRLRQWLPWVDRTRSPEDIREFISRAVSKYETSGAPDTGIWMGGAFAGSVGCHPVDWNNRNTSIGYWIDEAREGQGIMTRCSAVLLDYLFDDLRLHRVEIRCGTGNNRSCAIPERLGFTREGVASEAEWVNDRWVDLVVWSMLERDWKKRAPSRPRFAGG